MSNQHPVCTCTDINNIINCTITDSHVSNTATAVIEAKSTSLIIGNYIDVYMGYSDGTTGSVFTGYIKQLEQKTPDSTVTITANDKMTRAIEYFIAPTDPNATYKRSKVQVEVLVADLLSMAGLSLTDTAPSYFQLAAVGQLEVNLTSVYDYCRALADLFEWNLWCDRVGNIHFRNRKPYVMLNDSGEVDDHTDSAISYTWDDRNILSMGYKVDDKNLRNKVIVYGSNVSAESDAVSPYLPDGFYKTAVMGAQLMIDTYAGCKQTADINLNSLNRLTESITCSVIGDPILEARKCITMDSTEPRAGLQWEVVQYGGGGTKQ